MIQEKLLKFVFRRPLKKDLFLIKLDFWLLKKNL